MYDIFQYLPNIFTIFFENPGPVRAVFKKNSRNMQKK